MPRQKKSRSGSLSESKSWKDLVHFVEFSLDDELKIKDWYDANGPVWDTCLEQLFDEGWAVKISPPKNGDDWFVTSQFRGSGEAYDGHSFTVRYPDMETGVILIYWVITAMLKDGQMDQVLDTKPRAWLK